MAHDEDRILMTISGVVMVICAVAFGMYLGHRLAIRRIEHAEASKVQVDGHTLDACSLGCRTEDDVVCGRFVDLVKKSR